MRRLSGRLGLPVPGVLGVLASLLVLGTTPATVAASPAPHGTVAVDLDRPVRGADAVRALGERLDETAARSGMSAGELTDLLTTDSSAWVDTAGAVFFKEATATAPAEDPDVAEAPLDQTFLLHSKPGSTKTIYLDFDGGAARSTAWHASYPTTPTTQPAWDPAGNGAAFTDGELASIQTIWQAVAEDYAPFDVDVTTADPGPAGVHRSSSADTSYGSHVLITPSVAAQQAICPGGCGGVAYINVFNTINGGGSGAGGDGYGYLQPAWVFPQNLGNSAKNIAEAAAHEVGHNFGLRHDANPTQGYDRGHGAWAPIMGVGYDHPISQWSKGDYPGATTQEDDVAIIRGVAGSRGDEAPSTILGAPRVPTGTAYVTSREDVDTYLLGACSGAVSVTASALPSLADLDVRLTVRDVVGDVVATVDPPSAQVNPSVASGLEASVSLSLVAGLYYVSVDGVGNGPWDTGYDDYGSLGAYALTASGCDASVLPTATATELVAMATGRTVTLSATPTTALGTLVGDVVFREGGTVVGTQPVGTALVLPEVPSGTHTYTATFRPAGITHAGSVSPERTVTVAETATPPTTTPVSPPATPVTAPVVAPTVSASTAPAPVVSGSTTRITGATTVRAGTRPSVRVSVVRGAGPAAGSVTVTVGTWSRSVTLTAGTAKVRLPKAKAGKVRVRVRYSGDPTTSGSSARKTIKVTA